MSATDFPSRLRQAIDDAKVTQEKLGDYLGVSNQAVSKWVNGKAFPEHENLLKLADYLGADLQWLLTGKGRDRTFVTGGKYKGSGEVKSVPQLTPDQAIEPTRHFSSAPRSPVRFPCSDRAFQIAVWNRSNEPEYMVGDVVVVDPDVKPEPGNMVLAAKGEPPEAVIGRYTTPEGDIVLQPLNGAWPKVTHSAIKQIIGTITEHARPTR